MFSAYNIPVRYTVHVTRDGFLRRVTKRHKETKRSVLMSRKENNFAGQPVVFWERKNVDRCFGEEKELDNKKEIQLNMLIIEEDYRFMFIHNNF